MIVHKGDNILVASRFWDRQGSLDIAIYRIVCTLTNMQKRVVCSIEDDKIVRGSNNCVACVIPASETREMAHGTYFLSFHLWLDNECVLSNEVEQIDMI